MGSRAGLVAVAAALLVALSPVVAGADSWRLTGSMAAKRAGSTATRLPSGKVLVAGGFDGTSHAWDEFWS